MVKLLKIRGFGGAVGKKILEDEDFCASHTLLDFKYALSASKNILIFKIW